MSVFSAVCVDLAKFKPESCDMMWLFSYLACKEVYHIIFICIACLFAKEIGEVYRSLLPRLSSHPELTV